MLADRLHRTRTATTRLSLCRFDLPEVLVFRIFHAMDDSNELAQAITGNFMMLLCKDGEVSAPNLRTY